MYLFPGRRTKKTFILILLISCLGLNFQWGRTQNPVGFVINFNGYFSIYLFIYVPYSE